MARPHLKSGPHAKRKEFPVRDIHGLPNHRCMSCHLANAGSLFLPGYLFQEETDGLQWHHQKIE